MPKSQYMSPKLIQALKRKAASKIQGNCSGDVELADTFMAVVCSVHQIVMAMIELENKLLEKSNVVRLDIFAKASPGILPVSLLFQKFTDRSCEQLPKESGSALMNWFANVSNCCRFTNWPISAGVVHQTFRHWNQGIASSKSSPGGEQEYFH